MAIFKSSCIYLTIVLVLLVSNSRARRTSLFNRLAIRNAHPEDKVPPPQVGSAELVVGMEQTVPEMLPTSQRQTSDDLFSFGTELNDFLKELERYVAIAGRPRFGRSTDTQMKEDIKTLKSTQDSSIIAKSNQVMSSLPELHIVIKLCHGQGQGHLCVFPKMFTPQTHQ